MRRLDCARAVADRAVALGLPDPLEGWRDSHAEGPKALVARLRVEGGFEAAMRDALGATGWRPVSETETAGDGDIGFLLFADVAGRARVAPGLKQGRFFTAHIGEYELAMPNATEVWTCRK